MDLTNHQAAALVAQEAVDGLVQLLFLRDGDGGDAIGGGDGLKIRRAVQSHAEGAVVGGGVLNLVDQASEELEVQLSDEDRAKIASLMEKIDGLNLNVDAIKEQAKELYDKLDQLDFHFDKESVGNFFTKIIDAIVGFFQNLFG